MSCKCARDCVRVSERAQLAVGSAKWPPGTSIFDYLYLSLPPTASLPGLSLKRTPLPLKS